MFCLTSIIIDKMNLISDQKVIKVILLINQIK